MLFRKLRKDPAHVRHPASEHCGRFSQLGEKDLIFAIIRGVLAIIFGLIALFAPIATAVVLAIVIGV